MQQATDGRQLAIAKRAHRWVMTIKRLNAATRADGDLDRRLGETYYEFKDSLHLLMLALEHLDQCLAHLTFGDGELPRLKTLSRQAWAKRVYPRNRKNWFPLSSVRDVLEHEVEYVVGPGKFPGRVEESWREDGYREGTVLYDRDGVVSIVVLGVTYGVRDAVAAALELQQPLRSWIESLLA